MPTLNGRRGAFLLSFGVIYVAIGLNYMFIAADATIRHAMSWMPAWSTIEVCGAAWAAAGVVAAVSAFLPMPRDRYGFIALAAWSSAWAIAWGIAAALGYAPRGFVGALVFAVLTVAPMAVSGLPNPVRRTTVRSANVRGALGITGPRSTDHRRLRHRRPHHEERLIEGSQDLG